MLHLLIGIVALVWTLVGLWVLRRMWAISAAERRERKLERREQRAADWAERCERERRAYATGMLDSWAAPRTQAPSRFQIAGKLALALAMWGGAMGVLIFAHH